MPASLVFTDQGIPYSSGFDDIYHSRTGALGQANHVFLKGNQLPQRWREKSTFKSTFTVLETGFGLGINFLMTWAAWQQDPERSASLHFISIEKHPFACDDLAKAHRVLLEKSPLHNFSKQLQQQWPTLVSGFHRLHFDQGRVHLTLVFGDVQEVLPQLNSVVHAFYLDGFSPAKNPVMWEPKVYKGLARLAIQESTVATYTVAAQVRQGLQAAGFIVEKCAGYGQKRDMLSGYFDKRYMRKQSIHSKSSLNLLSENDHQQKSVIVIGAGLAGTALCERMIARSWKVLLIDQHAEPAQEASGNAMGIFHPHLSHDDNYCSRLTRAGLLYAQRTWKNYEEKNHVLQWCDTGALQMAKDNDEEEDMQRMLSQWNFPASYVRWMHRQEASERIGQALAFGGFWFQSGGAMSPGALCRAHLSEAKPQAKEEAKKEIQKSLQKHTQACEAVNTALMTCYQNKVSRIELYKNHWHVFDNAEQLIASAPVVVLANACGASALLEPYVTLPLRASRGQLSYLSLSDEQADELTLRAVLCGQGYAIPSTTSSQFSFTAIPMTIGATYAFDDEPHLRASDHIENLQRFAMMLPEQKISETVFSRLNGRVAFRCMSVDRLPLVGGIPDERHAFHAGPSVSQLSHIPRLPGLFCSLAYGSRGLAWTGLCAELLASQIVNEPLPLEKDLIQAVDPARFTLRAIKKSRR